MSGSVAARNPGLGGGFQYQWEVALWLTLCVIDAKGSMSSAFPVLAEQLTWLGRIASVQLEGDTDQDRLEDLTLRSVTGTSLHVQVKEKKNASSRQIWRCKDEDVVEFLLRRVRRSDTATSRSLFVSNIGFEKELEALRTDDAATEWRTSALIPYLRREYKRRNPGKDLPTDQEPPDTPPEADVRAALKGAYFSSCHPPDKVDETTHATRGGIAEVSRSAFGRLGAPDPGRAHLALYNQIMHLSIKDGGVLLSRRALRDLVVQASSIAALGAGAFPLPLLPSVLDAARTGRRPGPSWQDYEHRAVYEEERVSDLRQQLQDHRVVAIAGPAGSGKTVLANLIAARCVIDHDACAVVWDYEHDGPSEPPYLLERLHLQAAVSDQPPLMLLENVHRASSTLSQLLSAWSLAPEQCYLIMTSRADLGEVQFTKAVAHFGVHQRIDTNFSTWGRELLRWLLQHQAGLTEAHATHEAARPAWRGLVNDGWLIRLGVDSYMRRGVVSFWTIQEGIEGKLRETFKRDPAAEDLLYLVVGLGRMDVATHRDAAAKVLGWDRTRTAQVAGLLAEDGWLSISSDGSTYVPWHVTLAELYWTSFQAHRDQWAVSARCAFSERRVQ